ncbi:MAG: hypothetical protein ACI8PD_001721 [Nitrospinales bacterium]
MPNRSRFIKLLLIYTVASWLIPAQVLAQQSIGWVEHVNVVKQNIRLEAKIDTGADTSSIKAEILKEYSVAGEEWVQFRMESKQNQPATLELKIERHAKVKGRSGPSSMRPVVRMGICLGNIYRDIEVNLAQRKKFKYPILIGRNFLEGVFLVDSGKTHTIQPSCKGINSN